MSRDGRVSLTLLALALTLGVLADLLFHGRPLGIGVFVWAAALVAALALLLRLVRAPLHQGRRMMAAPLLVFAAMFAWHDSRLLVAVNLIALAGALSLGALRRTEPDPTRAGLADYLAAGAAAGFASFAGAVHLLHKDVPWDEAAEALRGRRSVAIARGFAIGIPLLVLFGTLFAAADAVFRNLLADALPSFAAPWSHVLLAAAFAWGSAGLLRDLLAAREDARALSPESLARTRGLSLGGTEIAVALAAVDALFLAFVLVQLRTFFGGRHFVESHAHVSYASYARHGFFELVAVAVLVLPTLLAGNTLVRDDETNRRRLVRMLSAALVALVLVVIVSALQRMRLYEHVYGLTQLRLYATGVMLWLAAVFAWLALTVLRGQARRFAVGTLVLGFAASLVTNVVNPDALIARTNLSRPHIDVAYLARLGDDAVPVLVARLPTLKPEQRRELATALLARHESNGGWTAWNLARSRARHALATHRAQLVAAARE